MMKSRLAALAAAIAIAVALVVPADAGNTNFLTEGNAAVTFPISPPNRATSGPGAIDNMDIGTTTPKAGKFSSLNTAGQIISSAGLPTIASGACGTTTNGAIVAGSTNQAGQFTIGAAATTTCTISFSATLAAAPKMCVFSPMNAAAIAATTLPFMSAPTTAGFVFNGAVLASTNWGYLCL